MVGLVLATVGTLSACAQPPRRCAPAWPQGRTFLSTSVTENGAPRALVDGTRIELTFAEDDRVTANAGCNIMGGTGVVRDDMLILTICR